MGRGRVQLKRIENSSSRHVTFSKRKTGLLKKANEISVLCDAQVALIVFNCKGKLAEFNSQSSSMDSILERYERCSHSEQLSGTNNDSQGNLSLELFKLTTRAEVLQKNIRNYEGEDLDPLSLKELQSLEHQLENALRRIRTKKNQIMMETISEKHKKEKVLKDQNHMLAKKLKEKEKEKSMTNAIGSGSRQETLPQYPFNFHVSPPQLVPPPPPTLTLGGTCEGGGALAMVEGDDEAEAGPSNNIVLPPWMMFHMTRGSALKVVGMQPQDSFRRSKASASFLIKWHPYQLDPDAPKEGVYKREYYRRKFVSRSKLVEARMSEVFGKLGLEYNMSGLTGNTMDNHRFIYFAGQQGSDKQHRLVDELFLDYFTQGKYIGDHDFLLECAKKKGQLSFFKTLTMDSRRLRVSSIQPLETSEGSILCD